MPTDVTDKNGLNTAERDVKGKGKATGEGQVQTKDSADDMSDDEVVGIDEEEEGDDDEEDDEEEDECDEDDDEDEEGQEKIDPSNIRSRRTRGVRVDYTSEEALAKAGLAHNEDDDKMDL